MHRRTIKQWCLQSLLTIAQNRVGLLESRRTLTWRLWVGTRSKHWVWVVVSLMVANAVSGASAAELQVVYIHGTNQNTPESHQAFNTRVAHLHPYLMEEFEKDPVIGQHLLLNHQLSISPRTLNFFWGDRSQLAITAVRRNIFIPQFNRGWLHLGQRVRKKLAFTLHDAIWVEQQTNKKAIISDLYDAVMKEGSQPILLMGHSAGSLVSFNFLLYRMPHINIQDFARDLHADPSVIEKIKAAGEENTCLEALLSSAAIRYDAQGKLAPFFQDIVPKIPPDLLEIYRTRLLASLPEFTRKYCLPEHKVRGLVTFGSPLALFYSLVANPKKDESYLTASMVRYMLENDIMWLHVNHWDDFIALPLPDKPRILEIVTNRLGSPPGLRGGFVANYLYLGRGANFMNAHSWYWNSPHVFSKTLVKAYQEGYETWYPKPGDTVGR